MAEVFELHHHPDLESPVMIVGLQGWIDAGMAAASATSTLLEQLEAEPVAVFDPDRFIDFRARRPVMHLADGVNTGLTWSTIELRAAADHAGNDVLLLVGAEPDHGWHVFTRSVVELALEFGVRLVTGLGAYPAAVPHTRPSGLASTATSTDLAVQVGFVPGQLDVPGGVQAAIEVRCGEVGLPAVGLWAQVPHYAAAMPYPGAAVTLVQGLSRVAGLDLSPGELVPAAAVTRERLDQLVAASDEHGALVRQLEAAYDAGDGTVAGGPSDLPSGDEIAAELERFLRDQDQG